MYKSAILQVLKSQPHVASSYHIGKEDYRALTWDSAEPSHATKTR